MRFNILISTIDEGINKIHALLLPEQDHVKYIVSHQYSQEKFKHIPGNLQEREDVLVSQIPGRGLSRNRNNAIDIADGDIAIIADDDIRFEPDAFGLIEAVYLREEGLDVACFKIRTGENEPEYKDYPKEAYRLIKITKHYLSSIEITFRIHSVKSKGIHFDPRFGLGNARTSFGEEQVFIHDCIKKGLEIGFFPYYIVQHPFERTRKKTKMSSGSVAFAAGAMDARTRPLLSVPKALVKSISLLPEIFSRGVNPVSYLYYRIAGIFYVFFKKE